MPEPCARHGDQEAPARFECVCCRQRQGHLGLAQSGAERSSMGFRSRYPPAGRFGTAPVTCACGRQRHGSSRTAYFLRPPDSRPRAGDKGHAQFVVHVACDTGALGGHALNLYERGEAVQGGLAMPVQRVQDTGHRPDHHNLEPGRLVKMR